MSQKVLLCCITPHENRAQVITNKLLFQFFSQFGTVKDTHIFERNVLVKAFIEFNDVISLENALSKAPQEKTSFGGLKVYPSSKMSITRPIKPHSITNQPTSLDEQGLANRLTAQSQWNASITEKISGLSLHDRMSLGFTSNQNPRTFVDGALPNSTTDNYSMSKLSHLHNYVNEKLDNPPFYQSSDMANSQNPTPGKVVIANRITNKILLPHLVHLFSCFGIVEKVLLNRESNYGLIEFETHKQANLASDCLKNVKIFGVSLKIKLSKYDSLKFKSIEKEKNERLQHFYVDKNEFPVKWNSQEEPVHPTNFLKISFCPRGLTFVLLQELFRQYHEPENIITKKEANLPYLTYIVGFKDVNHAVDIMAIFDNQLVDNGKLVITFAEQTAR